MWMSLDVTLVAHDAMVVWCCSMATCVVPEGRLCQRGQVSGCRGRGLMSNHCYAPAIRRMVEGH